MSDGPRMLDRSRDYGQIIGADSACPAARFVQDGVKFAVHGVECGATVPPVGAFPSIAAWSRALPAFSPRKVVIVEAPARKADRPKCGARTRRGTACMAPRVPGKQRCKLHGGRSTGPRSPEGKARALANLRQFRDRSAGDGESRHA